VIRIDRVHSTIGSIKRRGPSSMKKAALRIWPETS
jgi:hypothetical protein